MGWMMCNSTLEDEKIEETKLYRDLEFHQFGLILSAVFSLIAVLLSWYLMWRHCTHYSKPWEQRHIIRVLFVVPVYSVVSCLSYYFYRHAVYFEVIRDCYEAFAIASFFSLLCSYIAPDLHNQKDYFRKIAPRGWVWPISWFKKCVGGEGGLIRTPRSGLTWFNIIWFGVFQYCFWRVAMTLVAVITQAVGRYCQESVSPAFAHVWVMVIEGACVTVAMYCLIQFYIQLRVDLAEHGPLLKVLAIKLVIFLSFWQTLVISFLTSTGAIKASARIQTPDIKVGIPSMLLCIEMAIFSALHLWAFPWQVYDVRRSLIVASDPKMAYHGGFLGSKALIDAFNPWDLMKAVGRAFRWLFVGRRTRMEDISYKTSSRGTHLEPTRNQFTAFGTGGHSLDNLSTASHAGPYQPFRDEGDSERLLSHTQEPVVYPRPMERAPYINSPRGDIGKVSLPYDRTRRQGLGRGYVGGTMGGRGLEGQDTGYHGAKAPVPPPDSYPLGPLGRERHARHDENIREGPTECERYLGAGHGVRDNRF